MKDLHSTKSYKTLEGLTSSEIKKIEDQIKLNDSYNMKMHNLMKWLRSYNSNLVLAKVIMIALLAAHKKSTTVLESVLGIFVSIWVMKTQYSIIKNGDSAFQGFGVSIWIDLSLPLLFIIVFLTLLLVETNLHLTLPIELDVQNCSFMLMIVWCILVFMF